MIPREAILEMVQFIVLTLHGAPANIDKLPEVVAVSPSEMARTICVSVPQEQMQGCTNRAAAISAAYVRKDNKVYYNAFILHPETGVLGKSYIIHELTHWYQDVDFGTLTCLQIKEKELEAYRVQDTYLASFDANFMPGKFAAKFGEKFVCHDKN